MTGNTQNYNLISGGSGSGDTVSNKIKTGSIAVTRDVAKSVVYKTTFNAVDFAAKGVTYNFWKEDGTPFIGFTIGASAATGFTATLS